MLKKSLFTKSNVVFGKTEINLKGQGAAGENY